MPMPARPSLARWWLAVPLAVLLALVMGGLIVVPATLERHQPTFGGALPAMDRAVVAAVRAAPTQAVVALGGVVAAEKCELTPWSTGRRFSRTADVFVPPDGAVAAVTHIQHALPEEMSPHVDGQVLTAWPGGMVQLTVQVLDAARGWLRVSADSQCRRPDGSGVVEPAVPSGARGYLTKVFERLDAKPGGWHVYQVPCPDGGGVLTTVAATSPPHTAKGSLPDEVADLMPDTGPLDSAPDRVVFRSNTASVVLGVSDDDGRYTTQYTTPCTGS